MPDDDFEGVSVEQPATHGSRRRRWASAGGQTSVSMRVESGLAVVTVTGAMSRRSRFVCRTGLDAALGARVPLVVLDLTPAAVGPQSRPLLELL